MGLKSNKEMLEFGMAFAKKCRELTEELDYDMEYEYASLAFGKNAAGLESLAECESVEEAEGCVYEDDFSVQERTDSEYVDGQILCEGTLYETLYYYEDMGSGGDDAKKIYHELAGVLEKFGFNMDLSGGGAITLQTYENLMLEEKAMDEQ
jgi:hypothetical protein